MQLTALEALVAALAIGSTQAAPTVAELITTPTHLERYRKIVADASGEKPLPEPELSKATIWDFKQNQINATGTNGGSFSSVSPLTPLVPMPLNPQANLQYRPIPNPSPSSSTPT